MEAFIEDSDSGRTLQFDAVMGSWFVTVKGSSYLISDETDQSTLAVLPFLELDIRDFETRLSDFQTRYPDSRFPYELFIRAGFRHGSPHWTGCSLRWLSCLGMLDDDFSEELEKIASSKKRYSQKMRHLAKTLIGRRTLSQSANGDFAC